MPSFTYGLYLGECVLLSTAGQRTHPANVLRNKTIDEEKRRKNAAERVRLANDKVLAFFDCEERAETKSLEKVKTGCRSES